MFQPVSSSVNFPQLEEAILRFWKENKIFEKSVSARKSAKRFTLYEGPPTVNAAPGVHHVLSRVFKDVIPRYKAMKGFYTPRRGGWDTHGLPVELEIERQLGITSKPEIEAYGIEKFNAKCRESVLSNIKQWDAITERVGYWADLPDSYVTLRNDYIESVWWIVKQLWEKGLVYRGYRVTPHCPRCVTSLSSHEVSLGYKDDTVDPSIFIKFKVVPTEGSPIPAGDAPTYLLAWTTTPWTLPGNTALAIAPDATYALIELSEKPEEGRLILAQALLKGAITDKHSVITTFKGSNLVGARYEPLYNPFQYGIEVKKFEGQVLKPAAAPESLTYKVLGGEFVSMEDGTGIVHIAPAFGEVDYQAGIDEGLYFVQQVDVRGNITGAYPFAGKFVKKADPLVLDDLKQRGLLYRSTRIKHTYPFCWRCGTPLLYYAKSSWYIMTTAKKDRLLAGNERINWYPEHIKYGRFGDWLNNNVDWAFSRERYWGTPVPVWQCQSCGQHDCIGGVDELKSRPGIKGAEDLSDLHRPYIDRVTYQCKCGGDMQRIPEVMDCWLDSGAMPVAQEHYPFDNQSIFQDGRFPADYICEAVDQTRGWFYSLHALSVLLFDKPCFENVICLGHILDQKGEKMSKSKGNVVDPWTVLNAQGADALRWYLFTASPPGNVRRFSQELVAEALRKFLLTLWNTYSFFVTYANIDKYHPKTAPRIGARPELDRWILSELNQLTQDVTTSLENYDPTAAGRRIEEFVDGLSNWYVRRSRRRFWKSENDADKLAAYDTLYQCLVTVSKLLAPFTPFVAESLYQNLVRSIDPEAKESVHLTDFPTADPSLIEGKLSSETRLVMWVASLGRAARSKANLKVRQPLARVLVKTRSAEEKEALSRLAPQVLEELNVKELTILDSESAVVEYSVKPNLPVVGPKYGKEVGALAAALKQLDPTYVAAQVAAGRVIELGHHFQLAPEEVLVESKEKPGYAVAGEAGYTVAVETAVSPELVAEGWARELVHRLQTMRRSASFDIADYIVTYYSGGERTAQAMQQFSNYVKQETLSRDLVKGEPVAGAYTETHTLDGESVVLGVKKAR